MYTLGANRKIRSLKLHFPRPKIYHYFSLSCSFVGDVQGHEIVENMKRKPITEAMVAQGLDKSEMSRLINEANYQSRLQITFICT